jgi:putative endonuclease
MQKLPHHLIQGQSGEQAAAQYLRGIGWTILARNISTRYGEIDILAKQGQEYVCVEVRSRSAEAPLSAQVGLSVGKYQRIVRSLLSLQWLYNRPLRIDFITVSGEKVAQHFRDVRLEHLVTFQKLPYTLQHNLGSKAVGV